MRTINAYSSGIDTLLDFVIVQKAPFGFKPLGSLFGGGDKKPSLEEEDAEEKVPEGNRVYVDSKEDAPKGVEVLEGKRHGLFYDMTSLTEKDHGDAITDVFNNLLNELTDAQSEEAVQQRVKENEANGQKMEEIRENFKQQHPKAKELAELGEQITARRDALYDAVFDDLDADLPSAMDTIQNDKQIKNMEDEQLKLGAKIGADMHKKIEKDEEYQNLKEQVEEAKHDPTVKKLHSKLGNALIHSFKSKGFQLDDMSFDVDPDLKYSDDPAKWDAHIEKRLQEVIIADMKRMQKTDKGIKWMEENIFGYTDAKTDVEKMQYALAHFTAAEKIVERSGREKAAERDPTLVERADRVSKLRQSISKNSLAMYSGEDNTFIASPNIWAKMSKLDNSGKMTLEMQEALSTVIHESLHSIGGHGEDSRTKNLAGHVVEKESGLKEAGITSKQAFTAIKTLMEEGPVELISQCLMARKYNPELVGKDVFTDKAFKDGIGSVENHADHGYQGSLPHIARWALAYSGGSPKRARALLGKMREVGAGVGSVDAQGKPKQSGIVENHRLTNNYTASYHQYLKDYATTHVVKREQIDAGEGSMAFNTHNSFAAMNLGRGLSEGQDTKYGENKLPNISLSPKIRGAEPIFNESGNITQAGHLDVMHLIYGEG